MTRSDAYSRDELLEGLREFANEVDKVTHRGLLKNGPFSTTPLEREFGSLNRAKEAAGLSTNAPGGQSRYGFTGPEYYEQVLNLCSCRNCGENHNACLEFHHVEDKEFAIGEMASGRGPDAIYEEMQKTVPLCANCHNKHHSIRSNFDASGLERVEWPSPEEIQ